MYKGKHSSFIDLCLQGRAAPSEIDDYIESWHHSKEDVGVDTFLGMTSDEYALFVRDPDALASIIAARREKRPL